MGEFLSWTGWAGVSGIAQVLALVTIVAGVWQLVLNRRRAPQFQLTWEVIGSADQGDDRYHLVEFHNEGRASGRLLALSFAFARPELADGFTAPHVVASGEHFRLLVSAEKIKDAYIHLVYQTQDNRTLARVMWKPLVEEGDLHEQWEREFAFTAKRWVTLRQKVWPRPIAPGGVVGGKLKVGWSEKKLKMISDPREDLEYNPAIGTRSITDLPYVPPRPVR